MLENLNELVLMIVPLLFAVTIHEAAHGYAAYRMGDATAKMNDRLTLNPIKHLDPFGSILLPLMLKLSGSPFVFGYAKPVPVNPNNFYDYRKGTMIVASAGVVANLICAALSAIILHFLIRFGSMASLSFVKAFIMPIADMIHYSVIINLVLAIFNLIPVPPLDGSRILAMLLPPELRMQFNRIEPYGMIIIIVLLMTSVIDRILSFFINPLYKLLLGV